MGGTPQDGRIDAVVIVSKEVPHRSHISPRQLAVTTTHCRIKAFRTFADMHQPKRCCVDHEPIALKLRLIVAA